MEINRYDRQERIENWDQRKLSEGTVHLIGSGPLAQMTLATLIGLGVGTIRIYDNQSFDGDCGYLLFEAKQGQKNATALREIATKINPNIYVDGINWTFEEYYWLKVLGKPSVIIDCTNNPTIEELVFIYGQEYGIPIINSSSSEWEGAVSVLLPGNPIPERYLLPDLYNKEQGNATSIVIAGLIGEETRKILMPISDKDKPITTEVYYNLLSNSRFNRVEDVEAYDFRKDVIVYVVGAGSLGNVVAPGLARAGIGNIVIIDNDVIEDVNLNRQIYFYDAVGRQKSIALAKKIKAINPGINVRAHDDLFTPDFVDRCMEKKPDLIMVCTDSWKSRKVINDYALENRVPVISGGTSYDSGMVATYVPGETACLECLLDITKKAAEEEVPEGCATAPEPSVINSNVIIGGMMVGEMRTVFNIIKSLSGTLNYDAMLPNRLGISLVNTDCRHGK